MIVEKIWKYLRVHGHLLNRHKWCVDYEIGDWGSIGGWLRLRRCLKCDEREEAYTIDWFEDWWSNVNGLYTMLSSEEYEQKLKFALQQHRDFVFFYKDYFTLKSGAEKR